jgi:hypothetical protein
MRIRPARPDEATDLSALAMRSKAYWGYDDDFLRACRAYVRHGAVREGDVPSESIPGRMLPRLRWPISAP